MADLEDIGLIASPHTSAGRVPTSRGYRFFVDSLLTVKPLDKEKLDAIEGQLLASQPRQLISNASHLLSGLSHFAGIVLSAAPSGAEDSPDRVRQPFGKRILLILVTADGDVQNRLLFPGRAYTPSELVTATNYLNQHFVGHDFEHIRGHVQEELQNCAVICRR
jgi:heat-inducible transcriptional repressor